MLIIDNKPVRFFATERFNDTFGGLEARLYTKLANMVLTKYPVDMLVFEQPRKDRQQIRLAGYFLEGPREGELDETTVAWSAKSLETPKFWLKLDDQGDHFAATFLFPEEY